MFSRLKIKIKQNKPNFIKQRQIEKDSNQENYVA